ncbi:MAG: peptidoglycan-associated lipoprotein Pal [Elusimicrobia bacterium]|nr:peptidoglycan-associated lipoprotein Pal [Elusimicrobiota bacterium]
MTTTSTRWLLVALCAATTLACAPRKTVKNGTNGTNTADANKNDDADTLPPGVESGEASIKDGSQFSETPELQSITFGYDAYALQDEARATLRKNAEYLKQHRDLEILVAGHCDERGTTEYNLALGQKRAKEVREYYIRLGIPGKAIATISYGEEKPVCDQPTEDCWNKNRRAETRIRARTASSQQGVNPKAPQ